jgi:hypothetical protein
VELSGHGLSSVIGCPAKAADGRPMDSESNIDRLVAARMDRQTILASQNSPVLWYVIDEAVLRRSVGGPSVMGPQLDALITAAATPGIVIQVLPLKDDNPGTDGPVSVYEFADVPTVCYTECYAGGRIVEAPARELGIPAPSGRQCRDGP